MSLSSKVSERRLTVPAARDTHDIPPAKSVTKADIASLGSLKNKETGNGKVEGSEDNGVDKQATPATASDAPEKDKRYDEGFADQDVDDLANKAAKSKCAD